jgi:hypothetical protein
MAMALSLAIATSALTGSGKVFLVATGNDLKSDLNSVSFTCSEKMVQRKWQYFVELDLGGHMSSRV